MLGIPREFSNSFLLALCATSDRKFNPDEKEVQRAFKAVIDKTAELEGVPTLEILPNPLSGRYPCFQDMLLDGIRTETLRYSGKRVYSGLSKEGARKRLGNSPGYVTLAETFLESS